MVTQTIKYKLLIHVFKFTKLSIILACLSPVSLFAAPQGGSISGGQGNINHSSANATVINQASQNMAIDWQSFNLSAQDSVRFNQPNQAATVLNRIHDQNPSQIFGSINANGRVFLMNPNGILFGHSAKVNVGALVASGMSISNEDFFNQNYEFNNIDDQTLGYVINRGLLQAATGGSINLVGKSVANEGVIVASQGQVNIGAANKITLDFDGDGLIQFQVGEDLLNNAENLDAAISNSGEISAEGGNVLILSSVAENVFNQAINNSGYISAGRIENKNGIVRLVAADNTIVNNGEINVSALDESSAGGVSIQANYIEQTGNISANGGEQGNGGDVLVVATDTLSFEGEISALAGNSKGNGGFVELSGHKHVDIQGNVHLDSNNGEAGTLLIDPGSINIVDGTNTAPPGTLDTFNDGWIESQLTSGNLILQTDNSTVGGAEDITIDSAASISWGNANSLTLEAGRNISVDGTISAASGTLNLQAGQDGAGGNIDLTNSNISAATVNLTGGGGTDTLTGQSAGATWSITGANTGNINGTFNFSSIENLIGGTGNDTFNVNNNFTGSLNGGNGNDTFDFVDGVVVTGAINGGAGSDTLDWSNYSSARNVTLTDVGTSDGFQGQQASITGDFDNIDVLTSSNNSETLTGANLSNSWSITGVDDGSVTSGGKTINYTNFVNILGGSGADDIVLAGGSVTGSINGGAGTDNLTANNGGKTFTVTGAAAGNLTDVSGGFTNMERLIGGTGTDTFTINANFSGGINGGTGTDTVNYTALVAPITVTLGTAANAGEVTGVETIIGEAGSTLAGDNGNNTWTTTGIDQGTVTWAGGAPTAFSGFVTINAGSGNDTFNFGDDFTNTINAGGGADQFNIDSAVSGTLNGDSGNDTFNINQNTTGNVNGGADNDSFIFDDAKVIAGSVDGGTDTDTLNLAAYSGAVAWSITGAGSGNADTNNIDFTTIESIEGSSDVDTFIYASGGSLAGTVNSNAASDIFTFQSGSNHLGTINGGAGDEAITFQTGSGFNAASVIDGGTQTVQDTVDYSALASASVTLETHVTDVEVLTGGGASFTLTGNNASNTWTLNGGGTETVAGYTFSGFNAIIGGTGVDTFDITTDYVDSVNGGSGNDIFNINVATTNTINGGAGNDTFNLNTNFSGTVGGGNDNDTFNLIGNVATGTINGEAGTDTVVGDDLDNGWALNNPNEGIVTNVNGSVNFATVENLTGLTGVDTFTIATAGTISGIMAGGDNNDVYIYSLNSTITGTIDGGNGASDSVNYSAINAARTVTLGATANVTINTETLTGDTDAAITLVGDNTSSTWTTTGAMAGTFLSGASTVTFTDMTNITGGTGSDTFDLDVAFSGAVDGGNGGDTFNITDGQAIGSLSGGSGNDKIVGDNVINIWNVTGSNSGDLNGQLFGAMENLTGGTNTDTFNIEDSDGVNGIIDGGTTASVDTLNIAAYSTALTVTLSGIGTNNGLAGSEASVGSFDNINTMTGGSHGSDELIGFNAGAAWGIDGTNQYVSTNTLDFSAFELLTGNSNIDTFTFTGAQAATVNGAGYNDQFIFNAGAVLTGSIDGAAGADEITWNAYTSRDIVLSSVGATDGFNGNDDSASDSIISGSTDFYNIDTIVASTAGSTDILTGIDATASWGIDGSNQYTSTNILDISNFETLDGGGGADTFTITGAQTMVLNGNVGADNFIFADNAANLTGNIDGGSQPDTLNWSAVSVNRDVSITAIGTTDGLAGTQTDSISAGFDNIEFLIGTDTGDTLSTSLSTVNTWDILGSDDGVFNSGANAIGFINYANLVGGTGNDAFDFGASGSLSGLISDGGGAADSADYSLITTPVTIAIGTDITDIETITGNNSNHTLVGLSDVDYTWNISNENDGSVGLVTFVNIANLTGGSKDDDFLMGALGSITGTIDGGNHSIEDIVNYAAVTDPVTVTVGTDVVNIERLIGDTLNDKIVGPDAVNVWTITGIDDGTLLSGGLTTTFVDMKNIDGNDDVDTFHINTVFGGSIAGFDEEDIFNLSNSVTGSISGGSGDDTFNYIDGVSIGSLSGGGDTDTLVADNVINTWNITGSFSGTLNGQAFSTMDALVGNANVDTYNIDSSFSGAMSGEANNDFFIFADTTTVGGLVDGGIGSDTANWSAYTTARTVTLSGLGTNNGFAGSETSTTTGFDNINIMSGSGSNNGTITGINATASWEIDGTNQYVSTRSLDFTNFINYTGGSGNDTFNLDVDHTGNLIGGDGNDNFDFANTINLTGSIDGGVGTDTLDWADYLTGREITLSATGANNGFSGNDVTSADSTVTLGFDNINILAGSSTATNVLTGINANATWGIDGSNQYTSTNTLDFSNFQNLIGGSLDDTFNLDVNHTGNLVGGDGNDSFDFANTVIVTGSIDGGAGSDTLDWTDYLTGRTIVLSALGTANGFKGPDTSITLNFDNINELIGSSTATDSLTGINADADWNIDGTNQYDSTNTLDFSNFDTLIGNDGVDAFTLNGAHTLDLFGMTGDDEFVFADEAAALTGSIDGGTGVSNSINWFAATTTRDVTITGLGSNVGFAGTQTSVSGGFDNIDYVVGSGIGNGDVLTGPNEDTDWTFTNALLGSFVSSSRTLGFSNFTNYTGGIKDDDFIMAIGGEVPGVIDGGAHTIADTVDYSATTITTQVELGTDIVNIEIVIGDNNLHSLVAPNEVNTWDITNWGTTDGINDGTLVNATTISFENFSKLTGGTNDDDFTLINGTIGSIDGNGGTNSLQADDVTNDWSITAADEGLVTGVGSYTGIENITGGSGTDSFIVNGGSVSGTLKGGGGVNALTAANSDNIWDITGADSGSVENINAFTQIANLTGGSSDDDFKLNGGTVSGTVAGGSGDDSITADNIATNTWNITDANIGNVTGINSFSSIENLIGQSNTDNFIFDTNGSFVGVINGAGSSDSVDMLAVAGAISVDLSNNSFLSIENFIGNNSNSTLIANNTANTWRINSENDGLLNSIVFNDFNHLVGGSGTDDFILSSSGSITGSILGGSGQDSLKANNIENTWNITGTEIGNMNSVASFSQLEELIGNSDTDKFIFSDGSSFTGNIDGGDETDTIDYALMTSPLTVNLNDSSINNIEIYIGNNTNSTLQADDVSNDWIINDENDGTVAGLQFFNFTSLAGGAVDDTFTLSGGTISNSIDGGDGIDSLTADNLVNTWNITGDDSGNVTGVTNYSQIENLIGNANTDEFRFTDSGLVTGTLDGKDNTDTVDYSAVTGSVSVDLINNNYLNIEKLIGNNVLSTIIAGNASNDWVISDENDGAVAGWDFTNFNHLSGGEGVDNFMFSSGAITGSINGNDGNDTISANNSDNTWVLNADNAGNTTSIASFENIENLAGGSGNDSFQLNGYDLSGVIDGSTGSDSLIAHDTINDWQITSTNSGTLNNEYNFTNINHLVGGDGIDNFSLAGGTVDGSIAGGNGSDSLIADNVANVWNITGSGSGDVTGVALFSSIENLVGNNNTDSFIFSSTGDISGFIDGANHNDIIDYTQLTESMTVTLGASGVNNIETIRANSSGNTLHAEDINNDWHISGENSGQINNIVFTGFSNLMGGNDIDTFTFEDGSITGYVNGANGSDTLLANSKNNNWIINGIDQGRVNDINSFSTIENIVGGSETDSIIFTSQGRISGTIDLGEANDNVDYSAISTATNVSIGKSLSNAENIIAGTSFTLTADDTVNNWYLTETGNGTLNNIEFTGFVNLAGGADSDSFIFANDAGLTGFVDGRAGVDSMDWTAYFTVRTVTLTGDGTIDGNTGIEDSIGLGFDNIEEFIGTDVISNLAESLAAAGKNQTDDLYLIAYQSIPDTLVRNRLFSITDTGIRLPKDLLEAQSKE